MKTEEALLLLLYCGFAVGLSLENLPRRLDLPSVHRLSSYDTKDDGSDDYFGTAAKKRNREWSNTQYSGKSGVNDHDDFWDISYPVPHNLKDQVKREAKKSSEEHSDQELANILKDDDSGVQRDRKIPPDAKKSVPAIKRKRESEKVESSKSDTESDQDNQDFQEWLRREYYRNMAKSFASMRKKRAMWGPFDEEQALKEDVEHRPAAFQARGLPAKRQRRTSEDVRFEQVTDSLKSIEDALLADALKVIKESGEEFEDDRKVRRRIANDLNAAYDIETMRAALFRLKGSLYGDEEISDEYDDFSGFRKYKRRVPWQQRHPDGFSLTPRDSPSAEQQCPPLAALTSDCAALGDTVADESLKELLSYACNWHEVCYSCGDVFGLTSDNCDMGFVEQSRTICHGDLPCESTARLLLLPLRQRRIFFKRSSPNICLVNPCVEDFLTRG